MRQLQSVINCLTGPLLFRLILRFLNTGYKHLIINKRLNFLSATRRIGLFGNPGFFNQGFFLYPPHGI